MIDKLGSEAALPHLLTMFSKGAAFGFGAVGTRSAVLADQIWGYSTNRCYLDAIDVK